MNYFKDPLRRIYLWPFFKPKSVCVLNNIVVYHSVKPETHLTDSAWQLDGDQARSVQEILPSLPLRPREQSPQEAPHPRVTPQLRRL